MRWPPNKSWTSKFTRNGFRHFVAINYGGEGNSRWVNLVAVLDGSICFRLNWEEMKDKKKWINGWIKINKDELRQEFQLPPTEEQLSNGIKDVCLHPSLDSGLIIPSEEGEIRDWDTTSNK